MWEETPGPTILPQEIEFTGAGDGWEDIVG